MQYCMTSGPTNAEDCRVGNAGLFTLSVVSQKHHGQPHPGGIIVGQTAVNEAAGSTEQPTNICSKVHANKIVLLTAMGNPLIYGWHV